jgi:hypothetical protein
MDSEKTRITITGKMTYADELTLAQAAKIVAYLNTAGGDLLDSSRQQVRTGAARKVAPKTKSPKAVKPDSLADVDEFPATMSGFPSYSKMKTEKDRLLWILTFMRDQHQRKGLANKEIAWISDHIGAGIKSDNIAGAFNSAKASGYALRSTMDNSIRVTDEGVEHLTSVVSES